MALHVKAMKSVIPLAYAVACAAIILIDVVMGMHFARFMRIVAGVVDLFLVAAFILHLRRYARIVSIATKILRAAGVNEI